IPALLAAAAAAYRLRTRSRHHQGARRVAAEGSAVSQTTDDRRQTTESRPHFVVPEQFVRNNAGVLAQGTPFETGMRLLAKIAGRLGRADLAGLDMLDFGCGTRFTDCIINGNVPVRSYFGLDSWPEMIEFLDKEAIAADARLAY